MNQQDLERRRIAWHGFALTVVIEKSVVPQQTKYFARIESAEPGAPGFTFQFAEKEGATPDEAIERVMSTVAFLAQCTNPECRGTMEFQHSYGASLEDGPADMAWRCGHCDTLHRWSAATGDWNRLR